MQERNEELKKEAAEAKIAVLDTRLLMIRLIDTARKAQGTLIKLVSTISDYDLTSNEKNYLRSLAKDNNLMIDELKSELPHFFNRIFVDFDQEFHE